MADHVKVDRVKADRVKTDRVMEDRMERKPVKYPQIVHTWMYGGLSIESIADSLAKTGAAGADLSISNVNPHNDIRLFEKLDLAGIFSDRGLEVKAVTPRFFERDLDLSNPDKAIRDNATGFCKRCIELSRALCCDLMLVVPSWINGPPMFHISREDDCKRAAESLARLAEFAAGFDVTLMIEPINRYIVSLVHTVEEAARMAVAAGMRNVAVAPDTFHMNIEEPDGIPSAIRRCGSNLKLLHVGEQNRRAPGNGVMDWRAILSALADIGYDGCLSHEPFSLYFDPVKVAADPDYRAGFEKELIDSIEFLEQCMIDMHG